ncbi:hypothetical protein BDV96DRAFT_308498 [Lophiotrema nucula]|uniref:Uncharacterized protein n=1 Tax=Lophiotrema nucula TaxID=690887 RepID=A0A6A5YIE2_9PLEO|nr:hypothetical protein BDV96DRAFT_308498 [Lophiotrema nucula]
MASEESRPTLLLLAQEVRDEIYRLVFTATRLRIGERWKDDIRHLSKPAKDSLALLQTCKQLHEEIGDTWKSYVLFDFVSVFSFMDTLSSLPTASLDRVRHARVYGGQVQLQQHTGVPLTSRVRTTRNPSNLGDLLNILTGLKLDSLTVLLDHRCSAQGEVIRGIITTSVGWKNLYVMTQSRTCCQSDWTPAVRHLGCTKPGLNIAVYRSLSLRKPMAVLDPDDRVLVTRDMKSAGLWTGEILVIAKRKFDEEPLGGFWIQKPLDLHFGPLTVTWVDIRDTCSEARPRGNVMQQIVEIDEYDDVEKYTWYEPWHERAMLSLDDDEGDNEGYNIPIPRGLRRDLRA